MDQDSAQADDVFSDFRSRLRTSSCDPCFNDCGRNHAAGIPENAGAVKSLIHAENLIICTMKVQDIIIFMSGKQACLSEEDSVYSCLLKKRENETVRNAFYRILSSVRSD